jgi:hypothetical protein
MPRRMPDFGGVLNLKIFNSVQLPTALEALHVLAKPGSKEYKLLHPRRIEAAYEMAFLRVFIAWEDVLEQSFIRYLAGYANSIGQLTPAAGIGFSRDIVAAESQLFGNNQYLLWHNPLHVIKRSQKFFSMGMHEHICQSNFARLEAFAAIRHRIAHGQDDARKKFDNATMLLAGRRYHGGRPGLFLRDWDPQSTLSRKWIDVISSEFIALIRQIVP